MIPSGCSMALVLKTLITYRYSTTMRMQTRNTFGCSQALRLMTLVVLVKIIDCCLWGLRSTKAWKLITHGFFISKTRTSFVTDKLGQEKPAMGYGLLRIKLLSFIASKSSRDTCQAHPPAGLPGAQINTVFNKSVLPVCFFFGCHIKKCRFGLFLGLGWLGFFWACASFSLHGPARLIP